MTHAYLVTDEMIAERDRVAKMPASDFGQVPVAELHDDFRRAFEEMSQAFIKMTLAKQRLDARLIDMQSRHDTLFDNH